MRGTAEQVDHAQLMALRSRKARESRWRAVTPTGRILACGIYDTHRGYDVRLEYVTGESVYVRSTFELDTARETADELRETVLAKPGFREAANVDR